MKITSRKNAKASLYRSLLRSSAVRRENKMFVAEGRKLCEEALLSGFVPLGALFTESSAEKSPALLKKISQNAEIDEISGDLSEYISDTKTPSGIFTAFRVLDKNADFCKIFNCRRIVLLDRLQDPGNLGTIIRSADAFGIDAVVASEDAVDVYSPKVLRSAAGSAFRLPVFYADLKRTVSDLTDNGFCVYAAVLDDDADVLGNTVIPEKTAIIIGNEGSGISPALISLSRKLRISIDRAESLNAAVAASIIMYEMKK